MYVVEIVGETTPEKGDRQIKIEKWTEGKRSRDGEIGSG